MSYTEAIRLIESAERIMLTTHVRCDGDAVGSIAALDRVIRQQAAESSRNCSTQVLLLGGLPDTYRFLLASEPWTWPLDRISEYVQAGQLDGFDLIVVADTSATSQLPGISDHLLHTSAGVLVIDHHLADCQIGTCRLLEDTACATGQIVFDLCRKAGWSIDADTAEALLVAIGTDTGWFRFANSSARAYSIAAELIAAGAKPNELYRRVYECFPIERLRLLAEALATVELHCNGRCATMHISTAMFERTGTKRSHSENMVNECSQIDGVVLWVMMVEREDGCTRCSFRSRSPHDVNAIARQLGGGGHARAAGVTLPQKLPQAKKVIVDAMTAALADQPSAELT